MSNPIVTAAIRPGAAVCRYGQDVRPAIASLPDDATHSIGVALVDLAPGAVLTEVDGSYRLGDALVIVGSRPVGALVIVWKQEG